MNKKKRNVIDKAHELFSEKGYHGTSIQDILDHSSISKGSFYNYFPSKGELFKAVFNLIQEDMRKKRDELLIGEDIRDKEIFIKQIVFMMEMNRKNKIIQLIEEVLVSNEPELIKYIKQTKDFFTTWIYERFSDIFSEDQAKYMVDCAVIYTGMMQNILYTSNRQNGMITVEQMTTYCLQRVMTILDDVSQKDIQLFAPENMTTLLSQSDNQNCFNNEFSIATLSVKKLIEKQFDLDDPKITTYVELLYFIQKEILINKEKPRQFLIESALTTLKSSGELHQTKEYVEYERTLAQMNYFPIV